MRIVSWNLGHQAGERALKPVFAPAVYALAPDVLILNEFVDGPSRDAMKGDLAALGLLEQRSSTRVGKNNQIFVASRTAISLGTLSGPGVDDAAVSNFFHVKTQGLDLIAVRVPAYSGVKWSAYWRELSELLSSCVTPTSLAIGDFNADPENRRSAAGRALRNLGSNGWQIVDPVGDWSFLRSDARTRIDHALLGSQLVLKGALYASEISGVRCAGVDAHLYDHAPLVVDIHLAAS